MEQPKGNSKPIIHFGTFDLAGKGPGTYAIGVAKLYKNPKNDIWDSANSFLKAADRCLNSCKVEDCTEILFFPGAVCAAFSCELFLKYIIFIENGEEVKGHHLSDLFLKCSQKVQSALTELRTDILEIFERNNNQFVDARYHHERNSISSRHQELLQAAEILSRFVAERYSNETPGATDSPDGGSMGGPGNSLPGRGAQ